MCGASLAVSKAFWVARILRAGLSRAMIVDASRRENRVGDWVARCLQGRAWLWFLPLVLIAGPVTQAWFHTCAVPRADHWHVIAEPYLRVLDGGPLWEFFHAPGTDSRHDASKLLHYLVITGTKWNLRVESMVSVALGLLAAFMSLSFWRAHPGPMAARWGYGWLTTFCVLSPVQWMNWTWGIQIEYTLVIAASVGTFWVLSQPWPPWVRTVVGSFCAMVAVFSLLNGWAAWAVGLLMILHAAWHERWRPAVVLSCVGIWAGTALCGGWLYLFKWPEAKRVGEAGLIEKIVSDPASVAHFFLQLLGAPFGEFLLLQQRVDRHALESWVAPLIGCAGFVLLAYALFSIWRQRESVCLAKMVPWLAMLAWGLGNVVAITIGRVGKVGFTPFQSRYPSFTIWFWVGVLGLLLMVPGRSAVRVRRAWLVIMVWGMSVSAIQGWWDGIRDARQCDPLEAAVAMRHAVVEPVLMDGVRSCGGEETIGMLDQLDREGLLHVSCVKSDLVSESNVQPKGVYRGAMTEGRLEPTGVLLSGWALNARTRGEAKAIAVSCTMPGEPERWLGIAARFTRQRSKAAKNRARVFEDRIGWAYEPLTGNETSLMTGIPVRLSRKPLPHGEAKFRAYGFDPVAGVFSPLEGEITLHLP